MNAIFGIWSCCDADRDQRARLVSTIEVERTLLSLINDILDFSKIEAGKLELGCADFDFYELIDKTSRLFRSQAESKGLDLRWALPSGRRLRVIGDELRLRQVVANLMGNAIKFTPSGWIEIQVEELPTVGESVTVKVTVTDTGIGLRDEDRQQIFDVFTQVDGSASRRFGGTGLGLSISKRLIELMGGRLGVRSELGKGSTFWFEVALRQTSEPRVVAQSSATADGETCDDDHAQNVSWQTVPLPFARRAKVLLAEDNPANQKVALAMLRMLGCQVDVAEDGCEAVAKAKANAYDAILMDCQMPNMDGLAATAAIRAWEKQRGCAGLTPIIALTANALPTDRERCLAAGMKRLPQQAVQHR